MFLYIPDTWIIWILSFGFGLDYPCHIASSYDVFISIMCIWLVNGTGWSRPNNTFCRSPILFDAGKFQFIFFCGWRHSPQALECEYHVCVGLERLANRPSGAHSIPVFLPWSFALRCIVLFWIIVEYPVLAISFWRKCFFEYRTERKTTFCHWTENWKFNQCACESWQWFNCPIKANKP